MKSLEEIEVLFRSQIKIPKNKPLKPFFFCPVGLVGSGKTTVTKDISERFNLVRISTDELRKILKENGYNYDELKNIIFKIAKEFAETGYSISFDMNCGNTETQKVIRKFSNDLHVPVIWVHVNPPEEFIINKLKSFNHTWLFRDSEQAIENYFQQKEEITKEIGKIEYSYIIDTSRNNLKDQLEELSLIIERKI